MHSHGADSPRTGSVDVLPRGEFLDEWAKAYAPGQHVTMIGPTQRGKTTLGLQLLQRSASPEHKTIVLSGKPPHRDRTMNDAAKRLNLRVVEEWPPFPTIADRKRSGYLLRPKQSLTNLDADKANLRKQFRAAIVSNYASKRPVITFVDEAHHVQNDLKLKEEYEAPLLRGAPDNAMWSLLQRGRFSSYLAYDMPEHIFIFYDPDIANKRRYSEIGGVDPVFLMRLAETLKTHRTASGQTISECIYLRRSGPYVCVVDVT